MRAGQAGPALGVKAGLVAPVTVRVYFTRPRAGTDRTNGRSWSNQKQLHRGSRTCRPFAPNQRPFKEDRGFIDWLDGVLACKTGFDDLQCPFRDVVADLDSVARSTSDLVSVVRGRVRNKLDPHAAVVGTLTRHFVWRALRNPNS